MCGRFIKLPKIKMVNHDDLIGSLSGGNQQKVILSRWLARNQRILILDDPTRGIDVGAKKETYDTLRDLAEGGTSIILVSSEFEEIQSMADRILIPRNGEIVRETGADGIDRAAMLKYAMAGTA